MEKNIIKSVEELNIFSEKIKKENKDKTKKLKERILLCTGGGCLASGALDIKKALEIEIKKNKLEDKVVIIETGCLGPCTYGPVIIMQKDNTFYENLKPEDAEEIIEKHIINGEIIERLAHKDGKHEKPTPVKNDIEFFKHQTKIVLKNCGVINPLSIDDYIGNDGYLALGKILSSMSQDQVIEELKKSGLRGRGGAGFPTYLKWSFAKKNKNNVKYVLCNADEEDPAPFLDRSLLEGDPHAIIEGMAICAYELGAKEGFVYVRAEYPLAVERLQKAINKAKEYGILGKNILGTKFSFNLEIRMGSGAFVCGEETALIASIEGRRGEPRPRPPFPADAGLWGKPTNNTNQETL